MHLDTISFGEVLYYTRLAVGENEDMHFVNVALINPFSPPDHGILQASYSTLPICQATDAIIVVNVQKITSVVAIIPQINQGAHGVEKFFVVEKPGLSVTRFMVGEGGVVEAEDVNE